MIRLRLKRASSLDYHLLKKTLHRLYSTSVEPLRSDFRNEQYEKELKKFDTMTNIMRKTRTRRPPREPFVKNLLLGVYDKEILTFPEMDLDEVKNVESQAELLSKLLGQKHMANVDSIGNKNFRQNLYDYKAIGLQASQFLDARECCPMETMKFLDTLFEHKLRDSLLHNEMLGVQTLNRFADDNLQKKYLFPLIKGDRLSAFAVNEVQTPDLKEMGTQAELSADKKYWTLNGKKTLVVNGISADFYIVFALSEVVTIENQRQTYLTSFVVEKDTPGVSWRKLEPSNVELAEVTFDNVQVPAGNVVGQVNEAGNILKAIIGDFRLSCGPACNAISRSMVNNIYKHAVEQSSNDFDYISTDAVKSRLGEMSMELYAAESVTYLTAGLQDWYENQDVDVESAIVKILTSEAAYKISTTCLDMVGQFAALKNHWAREAHENVLNYLTLYETNEGLRMFIALNGLQYAGSRLSEKIKKLRNPLFHGTYILKSIFTRHRQSTDNPKLDLELFGHLHPSCTAACNQLEYSVKRLEYATECILATHGLECVNKHVQLRKLADVMIDCYAMTAVLARASRSYCIGLQFADFEMLLATVYCNMAVERVRNNVRGLFATEHLANERNHIAFGKRFVQSKGYFVESPIHRFV